MSPRSRAGEPPSPRRLGVLLATVLGNLYLVVGTLFFAVLALLFAWVPPRGSSVLVLSRAWSRLLLASSFVRLDVEREGELNPARPMLFMSNHQSLFDIPLLLRSLPGPTRMLAKRSLFRIPIFGWALSIGGFIPVDRGDRRTARESFSRAASRLASGAPTLIFPEGTRTLDGQVGPFQRGGFLLALRAGVPIVPVGIHDSMEVQHRSSYAIRPRTVRVRYGTPIDVSGYGLREKDALMVRVRAEVARLADRELL